jgi:PPOX class probable F420-dependent enzyme
MLPPAQTNAAVSRLGAERLVQPLKAVHGLVSGFPPASPRNPTDRAQAYNRLGVRRGLSLADLGDLLELPLVAVLATHRNDGSVLLSPVWQHWREGGFDVVTGHDDVKARHLRSDPRATLVVYEQTPPYRGVELHGRASLVESAAHETARRMAIRYLGKEKGERYAAHGGDDTLIRLQPGELRAWDFSDEYPQVQA